MKKLGAFLAMISMLSLVPAAFAVDNGLPASTSKDSRLVGSDASHESSNVTRNEDSPQQATGYQKENRLLMRNHGFSNSSL